MSTRLRGMRAPQPNRSKPPEGENALLVDALGRLSFVIQLILTEVAASQELSLTQLRLLGILRDRTVAMAELARHLGLDRSSVTGLVERAERRGLVRREPRADDGRGVQVRILPAGLDQAGVVLASVTDRIRLLTDRLSGADRSLLTHLIEAVLGPDAVHGPENGQ